MAEQETSNLNGLISQARADLAERQGRLEAARRQISEGGGGSDLVSLIQEPLERCASRRRRRARISRKCERATVRSTLPVQQEHELQDIQPIQKELNRIMSSLAADGTLPPRGYSRTCRASRNRTGVWQGMNRLKSGT